MDIFARFEEIWNQILLYLINYSWYSKNTVQTYDKDAQKFLPNMSSKVAAKESNNNSAISCIK